ncbi:MAG: COQ9 family protein [Alphaproteobacteria bacterium]|nr:COQ9 family protein [Alphaproteobacteria bacterium]
MSAASRKKQKPETGGTDAAQNALRTKLLLAALPDVAFDGWHAGLLAAAARRAGISEDDAEALFPQGTRGLALYLSTWADEEMRKRLAREKMESLRVRDRVARGVEIRLDILAPWKQAVSSGLCYLGTPPGGLLLPSQVWRSADIIWQAAGDTATDYNRYTKRLLLSGVLTATILFWLGDETPQHQDTRAFLARRIDEALKIGRTAGGTVDKIKRGIGQVTRRRKNA